MFRIVQRRTFFFVLSLLILVPGIIGFARWGLRLGIDFTGGTIIEYGSLSEGIKTLEAVFKEQGYRPSFQPTSGGGVSVRLEHLSNEQHAALSAALKQPLPSLEEKSFETIGPTIGRELRSKAITATAIVLIAILVYITWAFRRVSVGPVKAWVYGAATIVALVHDVFIVVGVFALLGHYRALEVDSLFVTALLTVLGFSVHDTIVVFDRIRERLLTTEAPTFEDTVNESVNQTLGRSLNTSLTTLLVLFALFLFGGESIHAFTLALLVGITAGTYSSIFVASPLLVVWERMRKR